MIYKWFTTYKLSGRHSASSFFRCLFGCFRDDGDSLTDSCSKGGSFYESDSGLCRMITTYCCRITTMHSAPKRTINKIVMTVCDLNWFHTIKRGAGLLL